MTLELFMRRDCAVCGRGFDAKRAAAKFCGDTCRKRAQRAGDQRPGGSDGRTAGRVAAALKAAGRLESWRGAAAVTLAQRLDATPGSGAAALAKQLESSMAAALEGVAAADEMDELKARRDRKRHAG